MHEIEKSKLISVVSWENYQSKLKIGKTSKSKKFLIIFPKIWTGKVVDGLPNEKQK